MVGGGGEELGAVVVVAGCGGGSGAGRGRGLLLLLLPRCWKQLQRISWLLAGVTHILLKLGWGAPSVISHEERALGALPGWGD